MIMSNQKQYEFYEGDNFLSQLQTTDSQLYNYTIELCHKLDMKALKIVYTGTPDYGNYFKFRNEQQKKDKESSSSTIKQTTKGVVLTFNGFINVIIFYYDKSYYYWTGRSILSRGNHHLMTSNKLGVLVRKILNDKHPITDSSIINGSDYRNTNIHEEIIEICSKKGNIISEYNRLDLSGKELHIALELALNKDRITTYDYDSDTASKLKKKLKQFNIVVDKRNSADNIINDTLTKPFHIICCSKLHDVNECVVVKCQKNNNENTKDKFSILDMQACKNLEDYKNYESISGLLTVYKVSLDNKEDTEKQLRLNGVLHWDTYSDTYNGDSQIGHIVGHYYRDNYSTAQKLFILNT
tara:strand:- start:61 stop:1122 length:1062 start_codon:yes stop_codon:yes gene_type:complete